tara:strand:+ start:1942 stop:2262 length:321 start_codon:yes stop_codon:yes gene_type:complete
MRHANQVTVEMLQNDRDYLIAYFQDALLTLFKGEDQIGRLMIRDLVNATMGFPDLALQMKVSSKTIMGKLTESSNPGAAALFEIIDAIVKHEGLEIERITVSDKVA